MKAIKITDNELSHVKEGEIINFLNIKEEYTTVLGEEALVLNLDNKNEISIIKDEYRIEL